MVFNPLKVFKKKEKDVVIDLGRLHRGPKPAKAPGTDDSLGFLGNLASASSESNVSSDSDSINAIENRFRSNAIDPERFERFGKRIDRVLERIELIERKIERLEHRLDIGSSSR